MGFYDELFRLAAEGIDMFIACYLIWIKDAFEWWNHKGCNFWVSEGHVYDLQACFQKSKICPDCMG